MRLSRTILALGVASLLTDLSAEMIYPLLPTFLAATLGAGAMALGVIEGVAEATASLLKIVSGLWTDRTGRRKPFVVGGYTVSGLARPMIGLASGWPFVLLMRALDRVGKGIRTSPRDALIADVAPAEARGYAYGFHRSMDHCGAVFGPLVAALLLEVFGFPVRTVILCASVPAALVLFVLVLGVREPDGTAPTEGARIRLRDLARMGPAYHRFLLALFVFTLGNSADAFLLLRLREVGISVTGVALLWSAHHVVRVFATWKGGAWADRRGRRTMLFLGWGIYAVVYAAFAFADSMAARITVFMVYGIYYGLTEPAMRAMVADLVPKRVRGTAFGFFHATIGIAALPASILFGFLYQKFGPGVAFGSGAGFAAAAALLLARVPSLVSSRS